MRSARQQMSGGGTVVTFELEGGKAEAFRLLDALQIIDISNNLGDSKSLITHPATTTHRRLGEEARLAVGITDGIVRISVGLEDPDDLLEDLETGPEPRSEPGAASSVRLRAAVVVTISSGTTTSPRRKKRRVETSTPTAWQRSRHSRVASEAQSVSSGPQLTPRSRATSRVGEESATGSSAR